jgi:hypothetical protein
LIDMTARIVKYRGEEGRDRAVNPSLNASHSPREALVAVLLSTQRDFALRQRVVISTHRDFRFASPTQDTWLDEAFTEVGRQIG